MAPFKLFCCGLLLLICGQSVAVNTPTDNKVPTAKAEQQNRSKHLLMKKQLGYIVELESTPLISLKAKSKSTSNTSLAIKTAKAKQTEKRQQVKTELLQRAPNSVVQQEYSELFNGLAISTELPAAELKSMSHVKAVYPNQLRRAKLDRALVQIEAFDAWQILDDEGAGEGIKIAVIDSGIVPEHPMFDDEGITPISPSELPSDDYCQTGSEANFCSNKLIVARAFNNVTIDIDASGEYDSPRGLSGHGTHVAAIATGREVQTDTGEVISGVAPSAYLMVYKALWGQDGTGTDSALLAALEAAYEDGADIINNSWGGGSGSDPVSSLYLSVYNELEAAGVVLVTAAGNEGEDGAGSISCPGCIEAGITVGSTTTDKESGFQMSFGTNTVLAAADSNYSSGALVSGDLTLAPTTNRLACNSFGNNFFNGSVAVVYRGECFFTDKISNAQQAGASGVIVINNVPGGNVSMSVDESLAITGVFISQSSGQLLTKYITSVSNPQVFTSTSFVSGVNTDAADIISSFSSLGPNGDSSFIKPDLSAPGDLILSATSSEDVDSEGQDYAYFGGTSMATPMVAGGAALLKQHKSELSAFAVKGVLVGATDSNIRNTSGSSATAFETGSGRLNTLRAMTLESYAQPANITFSNCLIRCSVESIIISLSDSESTWSAELMFRDSEISGSVSSSDITLAAGASQAVEVSVNVPADMEQGWYFGELLWTSDDGQQLRQAIALNNFAVTSDLNQLSLTSSNQTSVGIALESSNVTGTAQLDINLSIIGDAEFELETVSTSGALNIQSSSSSAQTLEFVAQTEALGLTLNQGTVPIDVDVSQLGSFLSVNCSSGCDEFSQEIDVNFEYLGQSYSQVTVVDNGFVVAGAAGDLSNAYFNTETPSSATPNGVIAPFWTDFDLLDNSVNGDTGHGEVLYAYYSESGRDYLVIQWHQVRLWSDESQGIDTSYWGVNDLNSEYTFQLIIEQDSENIWFNYLDIPEHPNYFTVGIEDENGELGYGVWFDGIGELQPSTGDSIQIQYAVPEAVVITVDIENRLPTDFASADDAQVLEDEEISIEVLNNDLNESNASYLKSEVSEVFQVLTLFEQGDVVELLPSSVVITATPENGEASVDADGNILYVPSSNFFGQDQFSYSVANELGQTSTASVNVSVSAVNDAPQDLVFNAVESVAQGSQLVLTASAQDIDSELEYSWQLPEQLALVSQEQGQITVDVASVDESVSVTVTVVVSDGEFELSQSQTITIETNNQAPSELTISGESSATVGDSVTLSSSVIDDDPDSLTYQWQLPSGLSSDNTSQAELILTADSASDSAYDITLTVSDGEFSITQSHQLTVSIRSTSNSGNSGDDTSGDSGSSSGGSSGGSGELWWLSLCVFGLYLRKSKCLSEP